MSRICLHDFSQKMRPYFPPTTKKICEFVSEDDGPLSVFFKLPISEISEIDDHKSVRIFIYPHSGSDVFELLKTNIRTLTDFSLCLLSQKYFLFLPKESHQDSLFYVSPRTTFYVLMTDGLRIAHWGAILGWTILTFTTSSWSHCNALCWMF